MDFPKNNQNTFLFGLWKSRKSDFFFFFPVGTSPSLFPSVFPHRSGFSDLIVLIVLTLLFFFCFVLPLDHLSHLTQLSYGPHIYGTVFLFKRCTKWNILLHLP